MEVQHKWSVWSAGESDWPSQVIVNLRAMYNNTLTLKLTSRKEIRWGEVTITGSSEAEDAPAELEANGFFCEGWDELEDIASTLRVGPKRLDFLADCLPYQPHGGGIGIYREFGPIKATSVAELLKLVDAEEDALIEESSKAWTEVESLFKRRRTKKTTV